MLVNDQPLHALYFIMNNWKSHSFFRTNFVTIVVR